MRINIDSSRIKNAEINLNLNMENDLNEKIVKLESRIEEEKEEAKVKPIYIYLLIASLIAIICTYIFSRNIYMSSIFLIPIIICIIKIIGGKKSSNSNIKEVEKIKNEIKVLKETREIQQKEAKEKQIKLDEEIEKYNKDMMERYEKYVDIAYLQENAHKKYDSVLEEIEYNENKINDIKIKLKMLENEGNNIKDSLDDLVQIEEELQELEQEKEELISLDKSFNIAKECLENAYIKVKENVSPKFTKDICEIISKISNGKYKKVSFDDTYGLKVEIENGSYIPISRLSIGTIDQMYLSLRLSAAMQISNERMPIILDEAFVYFDDERLKNILEYINENYKENQIIIFTCSNREQEILKKLNIKYNFINLEN